MNEQPRFFGPGGGLFGIETLPAQRREGAPTVLLLNAGLLHRVGPNRFNVELARRLAGDSSPTRGKFPRSQTGEIRCAFGTGFQV